MFCVLSILVQIKSVSQSVNISMLAWCTVDQSLHPASCVRVSLVTASCAQLSAIVTCDCSAWCRYSSKMWWDCFINLLSLYCTTATSASTSHCLHHLFCWDLLSLLAVLRQDICFCSTALIGLLTVLWLSVIRQCVYRSALRCRLWTCAGHWTELSIVVRVE